MKKLLKKIRNKRLKGNVSLLVIFILLASSVISMLSINQIQRLLTYGNMTFNYFRAFYIAKAGNELALTEVYHREAWFEHHIASGSVIVTWNLLPEYSGFNPYFDMSISWNFLYLTDDIRESDKCAPGNEITLGTGQWIVLSLFTDNQSNSNIKDILSDSTWVTSLNVNDIKNLKIEYNWSIWNWWTVDYFTFWLFDYDDVNWDLSNIYVETWNANYLSNFLNNHLNDLSGSRKYLTIKNPGTWDEVATFCIYNDNKPIPYSEYLVTVFANYGNMEVWLQSIVKKWVPDWWLNVLGD